MPVPMTTSDVRRPAADRPVGRIDWVSWLLLATMVGGSVAAWSRVPDVLPIHWNLQGEVDGTGSRDFVLTVLPLLGAVILGLLWLITRGLPIRESPRVSRSVRTVGRGVLGLVTMLHLAILLAALGGTVSIGRVAIGGASLLIVLVGLMLRTLPPNRLVGIRVPATLADDAIWRSTHRLGSVLMVLLGAAVLSASLLPLPLQLAMLVVGLLTVGVITIGYAMRLAEMRRQQPDRDAADVVGAADE